MNLNCSHFNQGCSGCALSLNLAEPPIFAEARHFFKERLAYELPTAYGALKGWRIRAKLAVRGSAENPLVGLFKEGTHNRQHPPLPSPAPAP